MFYTALINVNQSKVRETLSALISFEEWPWFEQAERLWDADCSEALCPLLTFFPPHKEIQEILQT